MNRLHREAERASYSLVPETCPVGDAAIDQAVSQIKDRTGAFRDALTDTMQRALEAEERVEDLERENAELRSRTLPTFRVTPAP